MGGKSEHAAGGVFFFCVSEEVGWEFSNKRMARAWGWGKGRVLTLIRRVP